jgi:hypothetical protein
MADAFEPRCFVAGRSIPWERTAIHFLGHPGFSESAIATQFLHVSDSLDFDTAKFAVVESANLRL